MIARGKREARRPWLAGLDFKRALKVRNIKANYYALSSFAILALYPGATHLASLGACPWLSYSAPMALWV
jgi:hypothetical protein